MKSMETRTLKEFADELASSAPAPGGGAVAALCASLAAALSSMVMNLTIDKKFYLEYEEELKTKLCGVRDCCQLQKDEFLQVIDEDTDVFNQVMAAFKLPKENEEEKAARLSAIQKSYVAAMEVPRKLAVKTYELFDSLAVAAEFGNPNAVSDAGVGALLAMAAVESAILNVKINLGAIKDQELVSKVAKECDELLEKSEQQKKKVMELVAQKIGK